MDGVQMSTSHFLKCHVDRMGEAPFHLFFTIFTIFARSRREIHFWPLISQKLREIGFLAPDFPWRVSFGGDHRRTTTVGVHEDASVGGGARTPPGVPTCEQSLPSTMNWQGLANSAGSLKKKRRVTQDSGSRSLLESGQTRE